MPALRYTFGPFELDPGRRRLTRDGTPVPVADRHLDVLAQLVARPGATLSKDALVAAAWRDVAVTDNSLEQAISALRRSLGPAADGEPYIVTVPRQGYRFAAPVTQTAARESDSALDDLLAPHRALIEGRGALETLERGRVEAAGAAFARALALSPGYAPAHVGLANALAFQYEATRGDAEPDLAALRRAVEHAREACRLDVEYPEAWATLGFILHRTPDAGQAVPAIRRAVSLEPGNWRHQLRLALISWGEERLRAAARARQMLPGLGITHWLAATVHVARQAFDAAERELDAGAAAQDQQRGSAAGFTVVGLHWLRGLMRLRRGDDTTARDEFERELSFERDGHLYSRECCANTWCAIGALAMRHGDRSAAMSAFDEALRRLPAHASALAALAACGDADRGAAAAPRLAARIDGLRAHGALVDAAQADAVGRVLAGDHPGAVATLKAALAATPPHAAGWMIPVDPLLNAAARPEAWAPLLATLARRAG